MRESLQRFCQQMEANQIDAAYIPTADYHESEYVHEYFKVREWLSGFTGSAGSMIITKKEACLWTDGRYFIQAQQQLADSGIRLMKLGVDGFPTVIEYISKTMKQGQTLFFDGRVVNAQFGKQLRTKCHQNQVNIQTTIDLMQGIWHDRPAMPNGQAYLLSNDLTGQNRTEKLARLRGTMAKYNTSHHIIASLDDIAWLLNIRGSDIRYTPVVLSYVLLSEHECFFFVDQTKLTIEVRKELEDANITIKDYNSIYQALTQLPAQSNVLIDATRVNDAIIHSLPKGANVVEAENPTQLFKSMKHEVELNHLRQSHIKDGVALTKFMYWLKTQIGKQPMDERSATQMLLSLRQQQDGFLEPSFSTIAAYQEHAAMMHYSATEESNVELKPEGLFLVDSGGQYMGGTTDVTRTIVLGPLTDEQRLHYTMVVKGMLALSNAVFLEGTKGVNLDILARGPLWSLFIDYRCGTGHGVGYMLGVHEGPQSIRWKPAAGRPEGSILYPGMVVTNEPGVYMDGSHGIRVENELIVRFAEKNEYGQFLNFETMTFAPIDLDGIDATLLSKQDVNWLNDYHTLVWETISPYLNEAEQHWLKQQTQAIQ